MPYEHRQNPSPTPSPLLPYLTNISVYTTVQRVYVVGENAAGWRVLKIERSNGPELLVDEDPACYSLAQLNSLLGCLDQGNLATGGLRRLAGPCPALVGCPRWAACHHLLLVTRTRRLGTVGGAPVHGIDATALVPLGPPGEALPPGAAAAEARARRLLSLVDLTKDFFFSFSWPVWATVQRTTLSSADADADADAEGAPFGSDRVWNGHLTAPLRARVGPGSRWAVPLVLGFFQQRRLSLLGTPLALTLVARRSCRFAGTRYRKRGISDDGAVANDVEVEQILEAGGPSPGVAALVQVRGSVPLYWAQGAPGAGAGWGGAAAAAAGAGLRPSIRLLHHLDPLRGATRRHFDDLRRRFGPGVQCLDLLRHGDGKGTGGQEAALSKEYRAAVGFLNRRAPPPQRLAYVHWDLRRHARALGASLLADLQAVEAPLLQRTGVFAAAGGGGGGAPAEVLRCQRGVVRTNCVDCLDRTNVAQFGLGLLALGEQAAALGLAPSPAVDPQSSLAAELMAAYEAMGHALAQQYGGSEAHAGFFERARGKPDWQAALQGREILTSIRRFYSNAVTDEDKQAAIDLFLGAFSPAVAAPGGGGGDAAAWVPPGWLQPAGAAGRPELAVELSVEDVGALAAPPLDIECDSPEAPSLAASISTASLASELDGGADISLPEVLAAAARAAPSKKGVTGGSSSGGSSAAPSLPVTPRGSGSAPATDQGATPRLRWWWRPAAGAGAAGAAAPAARPGLQSLEEVMPADVRPVRLAAPTPALSRAGSGSWLSPVKSRPATAAAPPRPPPPPGPRPRPRHARSSSAGDLDALPTAAAAASAVSFAPAAFQRLPRRDGGGARSPRDLRGELVVWGAGGEGEGPRLGGSSPVLPRAESQYHTLAGLNLEGAPELRKPTPLGGGPGGGGGDVAVGDHGMFSTARRLSFATLKAALGLALPGQGRADGAGGAAVGSPMSRSASAMDLQSSVEAGAAGSSAGGTPRGGRGGVAGPFFPAAPAADFAWMLSQRQAVAHGLDDLGMSAEVASLWRPGSNVVGCFAASGRRAAERQAAALAALATPLGPAERRQAEREAAAQLRPTMVVGLPVGKAC